MSRRGCLGEFVFIGLLLLAFGGSSYFWFRYFVRGKSIPTPNLVGKSITEARATASDFGLVIVVENEKDRNHDRIARGAVVWQNRAPGSLIKRGTRLIVGKSLGPLILSVPDLSGQTARTALLRFSQRNLRLGNVGYLENSGRGVIAQDPPVGTVVGAQTVVSLLVAYPPPPPNYVMPDLINRPLESVRAFLGAYGFQMSNVKFEPYPGIPDGVIIRQHPLPGSPVSSRDALTVVVSKQEETAIVSPGPVLR